MSNSIVNNLTYSTVNGIKKEVILVEPQKAPLPQGK